MKTYLTFTESLALEPLPLSETRVLRFVAQFHLQGLAPSTIKLYLSAIRAWVISLGMREPQIWTPRVTLACKAVARDHSPPLASLVSSVGSMVPPLTGWYRVRIPVGLALHLHVTSSLCV